MEESRILPQAILSAAPTGLPFVYLKLPCNALTNHHGTEAKYANEKRKIRVEDET